MRLIDADEAINKQWFGNSQAILYRQYAIGVLRDAPTAKIKKRAHWKDAYNGRYANPKYICSVCRKPALYILKRCELGNWSDVQALSAYCPHCGREMMNGGKENA